MSALLGEYVRSTSIRRDGEFPFRVRSSDQLTSPSVKENKVSEIATNRLFPASRRIESPIISPPPIRPTLPVGVIPVAARMALGDSIDVPFSSWINPPFGCLPTPPTQEPRRRAQSPGFLVKYTGPDLRLGERSYPLRTSENIKVLSIPQGLQITQ